MKKSKKYRTVNLYDAERFFPEESVGLNEEQIKAFRLVDNKTQELAEWDWNIIFDELNLIDEIDMNKMGFEDFLDEDKGELKERKIKSGEEIDLDSFADEEFNQVCPCCGFRFNE